jgi:hypothetical protein
VFFLFFLLPISHKDEDVRTSFSGRRLFRPEIDPSSSIM